MSEGNGKPDDSGLPKKPHHPPPGKCKVCARMMVKLSDFQEHWLEELHQCLFDTMGPMHNARVHLGGIRRHLELEGKLQLVTHGYGRGETKYSLKPLAVVIPVSEQP